LKILALIPARGGSKGIPHKNIAPLAGRPLIAWSIDAALQSGCFTHTIVSTDDEKIAEVSRQYGAEVPFLRPAELSRDETPGLEVCEHALHWMEQNRGEQFDHLFLLQPTSPLRLTEDILGAVRLLEGKNAPGVIGVCEASPHPYLARRIDSDGRLSEMFPDVDGTRRRQAFPDAYVVNGAVYLATREAVLDRRTLHPAGALAYVMPPERSLDIDTPWELRLAEFIMQDRLFQARS